MVRGLILPPLSGCWCPLCHAGKHDSLSSTAAVGSASNLFGWAEVLYPPPWRFGLYHFCKLVDSEETVGKKKSMAAGDSNLQVVMAA